MEELTEVLTWSKLDLHSKPIGLLNIQGYYDHYLQWVGLQLPRKHNILFNTSLHNVQLSRAIQEGFINASTVEDLMVIADNPKHLVDRLCYEKTTVAH